MDAVSVIVESKPTRAEHSAGVLDTADDIKVAERCWRGGLADADWIGEYHAESVG